MAGYVIGLLWKIRSYLKYSIVGAIGFGVHMVTLWFLTDKIHLWYLVSAVIAIIVAALNNYILNYYWTFSDKKYLIPNQFAGYFKYLLSRGFTEGLYLLLLFVAVGLLGLYYLASAMVIQIITAIIGYFVAVRWIWREKDVVKQLSDEEMDNERVY
jgi:putative flippase GtrA